MSRFMEIKSKDIEKAFEDERRQYFVGNLKKPQHIPFVKSDNAEMGLTAYDKFTVSRLIATLWQKNMLMLFPVEHSIWTLTQEKYMSIMRAIFLRPFQEQLMFRNPKLEQR